MQTLAEIKTLLAQRGLRPRRSLGQNFLHDHNLLKQLVHAASIAPGDLVLEVGPGTGALTEPLLGAGATVIAVELDRGLAQLLRDRIGHDRFHLVEGDCLADKRALSPSVTDLLGDRPFSLVANLPYAAATPLISTLLLHHPRCARLAITIQREVADRLAASPGTRAWGPLAIIARTTAELDRIATLPPSCFWPRPDVTSAMILLRRRPTPLVPDPRALVDFAAGLLAHRRKQLGTLLGRDFPWPTGIAPTDRAEALSIDDLQRLALAVR